MQLIMCNSMPKGHLQSCADPWSPAGAGMAPDSRFMARMAQTEQHQHQQRQQFGSPAIGHASPAGGPGDAARSAQMRTLQQQAQHLTAQVRNAAKAISTSFCQPALPECMSTVARAPHLLEAVLLRCMPLGMSCSLPSDSDLLVTGSCCDSDIAACPPTLQQQALEQQHRALVLELQRMQAARQAFPDAAQAAEVRGRVAAGRSCQVRLFEAGCRGSC